MDDVEVASAMEALALKHESFRDEQHFHEELFIQIRERRPDRVGRMKFHIKTDRLINKEGVEPDIMFDTGSSHFGIELKYVQVQPGKTPKDEYGQIPYDSIKDCAKLEVLIDAKEIADGVVIALTNYGEYWRERSRANWARNFYLPDRGEWTDLGDPLRFKVEPKKAPCSHPTVFYDGRFHVLLRHEWEYRWFDYNGAFRCMILRRRTHSVSDVRSSTINNWLGEKLENRISSIPFLNGDIRRTALNFQVQFKETYNPVPRGQKRDCPICRRGVPAWPVCSDG